MFSGSGLKIGRVMGIPIYLHPSWYIIFFLITFMLSTQYSSQYPQWTTTQHWTLGILTSLLFFASVLLHELGHSAVALKYKIPVVSITLFVFGGLAQIQREADRPMQEFNIAIAGPMTSFLLGGVFYLVTLPFAHGTVVAATAGWLCFINLLLGGFNLVPGFPLDGGRILRSIAWAWTKDFSRATQFASRSGQVIAYLLILAGVYIGVKNQDWLDGLWWVVIGWFLLSVAKESFTQVAVRRVLEGLRVADFMTAELPTIDRTLSLEDYMHEVLRTGRRCHLVLGNNQMVGMITLHHVRQIPREEWVNTSIQAAMLPYESIQWAQADEAAPKILERMQATDINQMPVLRDGQVVGMVSRDAMLQVIQTRMQLERLNPAR
jgi:Zn-dependent protease